jgi:hypothetical protein
MPRRRGESRFLGFFRYRFFRADGSEIGDAEYAVQVRAGETIWTLDGCELRVTGSCRWMTSGRPIAHSFKWRQRRAAIAEPKATAPARLEEASGF